MKIIMAKLNLTINIERGETLDDKMVEIRGIRPNGLPHTEHKVWTSRRLESFLHSIENEEKTITY